jgi:hypothetical protein
MTTILLAFAIGIALSLAALAAQPIARPVPCRAKGSRRISR